MSFRLDRLLSGEVLVTTKILFTKEQYLQQKDLFTSQSLNEYQIELPTGEKFEFEAVIIELSVAPKQFTKFVCNVIFEASFTIEEFEKLKVLSNS